MALSEDDCRKLQDWWDAYAEDAVGSMAHGLAAIDIARNVPLLLDTVRALRAETIVAAAIRTDGITVEGYDPYKIVLSVERPGRHSHVAWWLGKHDVDMRDQGFVTSTGRFVDRKEACVIARAASQVDEAKKTQPADTLFSEDLW